MKEKLKKFKVALKSYFEGFLEFVISLYFLCLQSVFFNQMVRLARLELARAFAHYRLKIACLPFHHNRTQQKLPWILPQKSEFLPLMAEFSQIYQQKSF